MEKENVILCCIITLAAVCYSTLERKQLFRIGKKLKIPVFSFYKTQLKETTTSTNLKQKKWYYRGEGNAYLTISIPETRQILRIKKIHYPIGIKENFLYYLFKHTRLGNILEAKARIEEKINLKFYHTFMYLLGEEYVQPAKEAFLDRHEIEEIDRILQPIRPENRQNKHLAYATGSLLADYAYFPISWDIDDPNPTYSVEIKPKAGWIPPSERKQKCTYCLNQYIKLQDCNVNAISKYCPMDIFSGSPNRMRYAVQCLFESPQNNLQIFKDGQLVYGERHKDENILREIFNKDSVESLNLFCDLITQSLTTNLIKEEQCPLTSESIQVKSNTGCDFSDIALPRGCVLERILNVQKLDKWGAQEMYSKLQNHRIDLNELISVPLCKLKHQTDLKSMVQQYLMAAVAKDLSLMITFKRILNRNDLNVPERNIITDNGSQFAIQIGVFDLYPKKVSAIAKHVKKQQRISKIHENFIQNVLK